MVVFALVARSEPTHDRGTVRFGLGMRNRPDLVRPGHARHLTPRGGLSLLERPAQRGKRPSRKREIATRSAHTFPWGRPRVRAASTRESLSAMGHLATVNAPCRSKRPRRVTRKTNTFGDHVLTATQKFSGLLFALGRREKGSAAASSRSPHWRAVTKRQQSNDR